MMMKRRDLLKTAGLVLGYTLTAGTAAAVLGGCTSDPTPDWTPATLTDDQISTLNRLSDVIIPGTDELPGAKDVNIAKFMDERLSIYASEEEKQLFSQGYTAFSESHDVSDMSDEEVTTLIKNELAADNKFVKSVYEQSVVGFCTSERGMKEVLVFAPIPGEQRGCIPVEEVDGIWAI